MSPDASERTASSESPDVTIPKLTVEPQDAVHKLENWASQLEVDTFDSDLAWVVSEWPGIPPLVRAIICEIASSYYEP